MSFPDLLVVAQNYGQTNATWDQGDLNHDGTVSFGDLLILAQNYGQSPSPAQLAQLNAEFAADVRSAFSQVPEPGLAGLAAAGLLFLRRSRKRDQIGATR